MTREDVWKEIDKLGDMCPADSSDVRHAMQLIDKYAAEKILEARIEGMHYAFAKPAYTARAKIKDLQAELSKLKEGE